MVMTGRYRKAGQESSYRKWWESCTEACTGSKSDHGSKDTAWAKELDPEGRSGGIN